MMVNLFFNLNENKQKVSFFGVSQKALINLKNGFIKMQKKPLYLNYN